ncbi:MAG TPA: hypothetical protein VNN20_00810 [Thermodesulfobacteriota bacterium]|nr:hypothetical protein [Thermodesulfobacteriota bacterium]
MSRKVEDKLTSLIHEIKEIKKELILQRVEKAEITEQKTRKWNTFCKKVSAKWDNISSVEEVRRQREKSW